MNEISLLKRIVDSCPEEELNELRNEFENLIDLIDEKLDDYSNSKYERFLKLYDKAETRLCWLKNHKDDYVDFYSTFWHELFEKNGYRDKAFKIYKFHCIDVDSSYEQEVDWFMSDWENACEKVKLLIKTDTEDDD